MWTFPRRVDSDLMGDIWTCRCDINRDVREGFYPGEKSVGEVLCVWFPCSCSSGRRCRWERGCVRVKQHSTRCAYCICVCVCVKLHTAYIFSLWLCISCTYALLCSCLSLSLCVSIYQLLPHTDAGVGLGGGWWGALQWLHSCLLLGESLHRGRLHSQSRRCRKLPGQWGGRARRWADARVLHGSFSRLISQWGCCVSDMKAGSWSYLQPSCSSSQPQSVGSLSWAVSGDSSSPGSSQE